MAVSSPLLKHETKSKIKLKCRIDLDQLLPTKSEQRRFDDNWEAFLASDPCNPKIFKRGKHHLTYESEQLIPKKKDKRPPLLLVLGNPASHSVHTGMFFSFEKNRKEHRFWKSILEPAGILDLPEVRGSIQKMNQQRRKQLWTLDYQGPYRIGLCVFITMPSAPGGKWGGVAGIQKLIGIRALRRLEKEEAKRIHKLAESFLGSQGSMVVFQKNAWNALRSDNDPAYRLKLAKNGMLRGSIKEAPEVSLLGIPPTRLSGPSSRILGQLLNETNPKIFERRYKCKPAKCPVCRSSKIARIRYGMPVFSPKLEKQINAGKIILGGCCITNDDPEWKCLACETVMFRKGRPSPSP